jgi:hypothetical protein
VGFRKGYGERIRNEGEKTVLVVVLKNKSERMKDKKRS